MWDVTPPPAPEPITMRSKLKCVGFLAILFPDYSMMVKNLRGIRVDLFETLTGLAADVFGSNFVVMLEPVVNILCDIGSGFMGLIRMLADAQRSSVDAGLQLFPVIGFRMPSSFNNSLHDQPKLTVPLAIKIKIQPKAASNKPIRRRMVPLPFSFHLETLLILVPPATIAKMIISGATKIRL